MCISEADQIVLLQVIDINDKGSRQSLQLSQLVCCPDGDEESRVTTHETLHSDS